VAYVKACKELYLGSKGIEKLRGFEGFVNLESLWLDQNKLKKINHLDANFRIKALYAQDNQICTLHGSLPAFTFLETLDLSNNQLRDLDKQLKVLEKFQFLRTLNLKGNPLVEEPDYRLTVIHHMPQLHVLDQHVVTDAERRKAKANIGGDMQSRSVAFMQRVPAYNPAWDAHVPERSILEQELVKEAATIKDKKQAAAYEAETAQFRHNPHPDIPRGQTLPPNAGMHKAQQKRQTPTLPGTGHALVPPLAGLRSAASGIRGALSKSQTGIGGLAMSPPGRPLAFDLTLDLGEVRADRTAAFSDFNHSFSVTCIPDVGAWDLDGAVTETVGRNRRIPAPSPHVPKDVLTLYSLKPTPCDLEALGSRHTTAYPAGPVKFEQKAYEQFVRQRSCAMPWRLEKKEVLM